MKISKTPIVNAILCILLLTAAAEAGEKSGRFYKHNSKAGFRALELKAGRSLNVEWNNGNTTPKKVWGGLTPTGYAGGNHSAGGQKFLKENKQLFGIKDPKKELIPFSQETDQLGRTTVSYSQHHNGIKIYSSTIRITFNADGSVESFEGSYFPTPLISFSYEISEENAARNAVNSLENNIIKSFSSEMVLMPIDNTLQPVYLIDISAPSDTKFSVYVNAEDGSIIKQQIFETISRKKLATGK